MFPGLVAPTPESARLLRQLGHAHVCLVKAAGDAVRTHALSGRLYFSRSGWLLLSVPNALGRGAFDALDEAGVELPPDYNAHISVMNADEVAAVGGPGVITERGHSYRYTLGAVKEVVPAGQSDLAKVWYIEAQSPDLRELRRSYGLTPQPHGDWDFHVTFAQRKKSVLRSNGVSKAAVAEVKCRCGAKYRPETDGGKCPGCGRRMFPTKAAGYGDGDGRFGVACPRCGGTKTSGARATQRTQDGGWTFANAVCGDCGDGFSYDFDTGVASVAATGRGKAAGERGPEAEYCPGCDARLERDPDSGTCNSCGAAWPEVKAAEALAGLLAAAPAVALDELLGKEAAHPALAVLLQAKVESDRRNYARKHALMRQLLGEAPGDFVVDSRAGGIAGLTHTPTNFRMHLPAPVVPGAVKAAEGLLKLAGGLGLPGGRAALGVLNKGLGAVAPPARAAASAVTKLPAAAQATGTGAARYAKSLAGYGPGGPLQGQKLFDARTVRPRLTPAAYEARTAAGADPKQLAATHELPDWTDRVPGVGLANRAVNALDRNRLAHPFVQTGRTVNNLLTTPLTRPVTKPVERALFAAGRANVDQGGLRGLLGRAQQAGGAGLWAGDAAVGTVGKGLATGSAGVGAYNTAKTLWNRPGEQAEAILRQVPGLPDQAVDANPELRAIKANPLPALLDGLTDRSELAQVQRAVGRRHLPYTIRNSASHTLDQMETDPLARTVAALRLPTAFGLLSRPVLGAVADPTPAPTADIVREELQARLPDVFDRYDANIASPSGQRLLRLLDPAVKDPNVPVQVHNDLVGQAGPPGAPVREKTLGSRVAALRELQNAQPRVDLAAAAAHPLTRELVQNPALAPARDAAVNSVLDYTLPPGGSP